jgi:hypothetical protein
MESNNKTGQASSWTVATVEEEVSIEASNGRMINDEQ